MACGCGTTTLGVGSYYQPTSSCPDKFGCPQGVCPDACVRRHDTQPPFKILVEDCNGPLDLTDDSLVLEVNMWAKAKLKTDILSTDTYFQLANNVGFEQIVVGDIIIMNRVRLPEQMLVIGFDEDNLLVEVQRGYNGTVASDWKKGSCLRIFRTIASPAVIETVIGDILREDGTTASDQILQTYLVYNWLSNDTCTPGCYWLEFKLLKMENPEAGADEHETISVSSTIDCTTDFDPESVIECGVVNMLDTDISNISFTASNLTYSDFGCSLGAGVTWVRRFPASGEAFLIKIVDSPTAEF